MKTQTFTLDETTKNEIWKLNKILNQKPDKKAIIRKEIYGYWLENIEIKPNGKTILYCKPISHNDKWWKQKNNMPTQIERLSVDALIQISKTITELN